MTDRSNLKLPFDPDQWVDADEVMFEACFAILGEFVENELGSEPWEICGEQSSMHRGYRLHFVGDENVKIIDLWLWYKEELPKIKEEYAADIRECYSGELVTKDIGNGMHEVVSFGQVREPKFPHDYPEIVKEEKLRELMDLRRYLWT